MLGNKGPTFFGMEDHLCKFTPPSAVTLLQTRMENESFCTPRQVARAKEARAFLYAMGTPSVKDLKATVHSGIVKDCPVTVEDVSIAEEVFGRDVGTLKGKTTQSKAVEPISHCMETPRAIQKAHQYVALSVDVMCVCGMTFLVMISSNLQFRTAHHVPDRKVDTFYDTLDKVFQICNHHNEHVVKTIHCDKEFKPLMERFKDDADVNTEYVAKCEHVADIE